MGKLSNNIEQGQFDGTATENDRTGNQRRLAWDNHQPNQVKKNFEYIKKYGWPDDSISVSTLSSCGIVDLVMNKTKPTDLNQ